MEGKKEEQVSTDLLIDDINPQEYTTVLELKKQMDTKAYNALLTEKYKKLKEVVEALDKNTEDIQKKTVNLPLVVVGKKFHSVVYLNKQTVLKKAQEDLNRLKQSVDESELRKAEPACGKEDEESNMTLAKKEYDDAMQLFETLGNIILNLQKIYENVSERQGESDE